MSYLRSIVCSLHLTSHYRFQAIPAGTQLLQCIMLSCIIQQKSFNLLFSSLL